MEVYNKREAPILRWILALVLLIIFGGLVFLVYSGYAASFDDAVREFIYSLRADWLTMFFKGVTFLANPITLAVLCGLLLIFPKTTLRFGIPVSVATGLGSLAHHGIKLLILRERPDAALHLIEESGYSFPSGHANASLIFYIFLAFLITRALNQKRHGDIANLITVLFVILIFLIGISRIYLGVHYPTDVLAGWCLGGVLLVIFISLYDAFYPIKYHLGIQTSDWARDDIGNWKRPENIINGPDATEKYKVPEKRWVRPNKPTYKFEAESSDIIEQGKAPDND